MKHEVGKLFISDGEQLRITSLKVWGEIQKIPEEKRLTSNAKYFELLTLLKILTMEEEIKELKKEIKELKCDK